MPRPKLDVTKVPKCVTLSPENVKLLTALGKGNLSAGIALVCDKYQGPRPLSVAPESANDEDDIFK